MSNKLRLEMSFKVVHLESDPNFADGWYLDVLERLVPGGTPRTTRYGPMATPDFLQALADDLCDSAERIMQNAVKAMRN